MSNLRVSETMLDRVISWLAPGWGQRRLMSRGAIGLMRRNFNGADRGRRTAGWHGTGDKGPNGDLRRSLPLLRERSRDQVRNNPWAASMVQEIVANMVHYGIIASFTEREKEDQGAGDVPPLWLAWAETTQCDASGRNNLYGLQRLVTRTWAEAGECFVRRVWRDDWEPGEIPFALQVLEPELIDHSHDGRDNTKMGIRFNDKGVAVGYWVYRKHPSDSLRTESEFVKSEDMIHVYVEDRPGQIRGIPLLAPIILRLYDLDSFEQAELKKQEIAAMFAGYKVKTEAYGNSPGDDNPKGVMLDEIQPGMIDVLEEGQTMVFSNPPQRNGYTDYVKQNVMAATAAVGPSYENVSGDFGRVTFLNGRMGQLRAHRRYDQWQYLMFIPQFCDRVAQWFAEGAIFAEQDMTVYKIEWTPPIKQMVDPERETRAEGEAVRSGAKTLFEMIRERGRDPRPHLREYKAGLDLLDALAITLSTDVRKVSSAGQLQGDGDNLPDDEEDQYEENREK